MKPFRILTLLSVFIFTLPAFGQNWKLLKSTQIDTLFVSLQFDPAFPAHLHTELHTQFNESISRFNQEKKSFIIIADSTQARQSIRFYTGSLRYVKRQTNVLVSGMNLALLGANILILPYFPPIIPFYWMPTTHSKLFTSCSPDMFNKNPQLMIASVGYMQSREKQERRFQKRFGKDFYNFFCDLHDQNKRNKKSAQKQKSAASMQAIGY